MEEAEIQGDDAGARRQRFAAICLDPTQVSILAPGQTEPETLDTYIRRLIREENANIESEGSVDSSSGYAKGEVNFRRLFPLAGGEGGDDE